MDLEQTRALLHGMIELINESIERILEMRHEIQVKPDGSPVTASDVLIENLIRQYLGLAEEPRTVAGQLIPATITH